MAFLNFMKKREELPSDIDLDMPPEPPKIMGEETSTEGPIDEELMPVKKTESKEEKIPELPPLPDIEEPKELSEELDLPPPSEKKVTAKRGERKIGKSPVLYIIIFVLVAGIVYSVLTYKSYYVKVWTSISELFTKLVPFFGEVKTYAGSNYLIILGAVLLVIISVTIVLVVRSIKKKKRFVQKKEEGLPELPPLPEGEVPEMPEIPEKEVEFPQIPSVPEAIEAPLPGLGEEPVTPKPVEPLKPVAEKPLPEVKMAKLLEKPVKKEKFITIDKFRQIRNDLSSTRGVLKKASSFFSKLGRVKGSENRGYLELCTSLQDIHEKITFINKTLFKE